MAIIDEGNGPMFTGKDDVPKTKRGGFNDVMPSPGHIKELPPTPESPDMEWDRLQKEADADIALEQRLSQEVPDWDLLGWGEQQELIEEAKKKATVSKNVAEGKIALEEFRKEYSDRIKERSEEKKVEAFEKSQPDFTKKPTPDSDEADRVEWFLKRNSEVIGEFTRPVVLQVFKDTGRVLDQSKITMADIQGFSPAEIEHLRKTNFRTYSSLVKRGIIKLPGPFLEE